MCSVYPVSSFSTTLLDDNRIAGATAWSWSTPRLLDWTGPQLLPRAVLSKGPQSLPVAHVQLLWMHRLPPNMQPAALVLLPAMPYDSVTGKVAIERLEQAAPHEYFDQEDRAEALELMLAMREGEGHGGGANVVE
eukprot:COSAG05_NODE_9779_length_602_cov_0.586481_1_plen_134_part_10